MTELALFLSPYCRRPGLLACPGLGFKLTPVWPSPNPMGYSFRSYHPGTTWDGGGVISCIWPVSGVFLGSTACVQARGLCVEQFRKSGGLHAVARRSAAYLHSLLSSARAWNRLEKPVSRSFFRYFPRQDTAECGPIAGRIRLGQCFLGPVFPWVRVSLAPRICLWATWLPHLHHIHSGTTAALQTLFRVLQDC